MLNINNKPFEELSYEDINAFLSQADTDENFYFEFKNDDTSVPDFAKEVCAFSNTFGGYILLGVEDDKTITGCNKWSEEKISTVMYNNISPTPLFSCRIIECTDGKHIFAIRIDEGTQPPYITNKGKIYERISSSSVPINNSNKLLELYNRRTEEMKRIEKKIGIESLNYANGAPSNLAAYVDVGFSVYSRDTDRLIEKFYNTNLEDIANYLKTTKNAFSISNIGGSYYISIGKADRQPVPAGLSNFIEIMQDGSVKFRLLIFFEGKNTEIANIASILALLDIFEKIYRLIFSESIFEEYIYALKYQKMTVLKQFSPKIIVPPEDESKERFDEFFLLHDKKYGGNLIVTSDRLPKNNYLRIDKQVIDSYKMEWSENTLFHLLFSTNYFLVGFIDEL